MSKVLPARAGTAAEWTAINPVLAVGEIGLEVDTATYKVGNGTATWSALSYGANNIVATSVLP